MKARFLWAGSAGIVLILALSLGCKTAPPAPAADASAAPAAVPAATPAPEPEHIKLQHILIAFSGKVPGKNITRTQSEAASLAAEVLDRARKGEDFDALVKTYTDDQHPGIYGMSNRGVTPAPGEYPRDRMVPAFGDVGFILAPGETGMAPYDPAKSPYGWHIIRRIE